MNNLKKNHALHNEKVCDFLHETGDFPDWVVTTAFYSALHFVIHKIFPCRIGSQQFNDFDSYYRTLGNTRKNKHRETISLVSRKCGREIGELYKFLHDTSWMARYTEDQIPVQVANKCREYLAEIKVFSTTS